MPDVEADLAIVLGTSLRVSPANDLPLTTASRGKPLVIVNLQRTPLDPICNLRIFAKTDEVNVVTLFKSFLVVVGALLLTSSIGFTFFFFSFLCENGQFKCSAAFKNGHILPGDGYAC